MKTVITAALLVLSLSARTNGQAIGSFNGNEAGSGSFNNDANKISGGGCGGVCYPWGSISGSGIYGGGGGSGVFGGGLYGGGGVWGGGVPYYGRVGGECSVCSYGYGPYLQSFLAKKPS